MSRRLPEVDGVFIQMEDEIASMAAIIGASYSGVKAMTATSGPGFSLMQENIGLAAMTETPCVVVNVMRAGPSTGQPTKTGQQDVMQVKWGSHGDYEIIALAPSSVQEMFDLTIEAFNLAEVYRCPTFVMADEIIGHLMERLTIPEPEQVHIKNRKKPTSPPSEYLPFRSGDDLVPEMASFGEGYKYYATGLTHDETGHPQTDSAEQHAKLVKRICDKVRKNSDKIIRVEEFSLEDADTCIFAYGSVARAARSAVVEGREQGAKIGLLRPITLWPFPEKIVEEVADRVDRIIVAEMNYGQLVHEVERFAGRKKVTFIPKLGDALHTPEEILAEALQ
jgi:2-oxoglutarate ferredoxin oxidoreductase subunit alpha